jgi:hypothetical protein
VCFISVTEFISLCYLFYYVLYNVPHYDPENAIFSHFPIFASHSITFHHFLFSTELFNSTFFFFWQSLYCFLFFLLNATTVKTVLSVWYILSSR